mmetsp:Transcript_54345/g.131905  ORF Transcript_54345/g.131905 Transcript_54345/m.131905 type:complete len:249 (+) Transcript_54345:15-761(+)
MNIFTIVTIVVLILRFVFKMDSDSVYGHATVSRHILPVDQLPNRTSLCLGRFCFSSSRLLYVFVLNALCLFFFLNTLFGIHQCITLRKQGLQFRACSCSCRMIMGSNHGVAFFFYLFGGSRSGCGGGSSSWRRRSPALQTGTKDTFYYGFRLLRRRIRIHDDSVFATYVVAAVAFTVAVLLFLLLHLFIRSQSALDMLRFLAFLLCFFLCILGLFFDLGEFLFVIVKLLLELLTTRVCFFVLVTFPGF